jgi:hypothetical protein
VSRAALRQSWIAEAPALLVITAVEARTRVNALVERYELGKQPLLAEQARHAMRAEMAYLHFRRARQAADQGRVEDARRIFRLVCDYFPDTQWAPRADARLQELERTEPPVPSTRQPGSSR